MEHLCSTRTKFRRPWTLQRSKNIDFQKFRSFNLKFFILLLSQLFDCQTGNFNDLRKIQDYMIKVKEWSQTLNRPESSSKPNLTSTLSFLYYKIVFYSRKWTVKWECLNNKT